MGSSPTIPRVACVRARTKIRDGSNNNMAQIEQEKEKNSDRP